MQDQATVITALSMINALGTSHEEVWSNLFQQQSPRQPHAIHHPFVRPSIAFHGVEADLRSLLGGKGWRHHQRAALMACLAGRQVLDQGGLKNVPAQARAVVIANGQNIFPSDYLKALQQQSLPLVNPPMFINLSANATASQMTIDLDIEGFSLTITTGFTAGLEVFHFARQTLHCGHADVVLAGGVEQAGEELMQSFKLAREQGSPSLIFSPEALQAASGEGCALAAVEHRSQALAAGRKPLAVIAGFGMGVYHEAQPGSLAFTLAMTRALHQAGLEAKDIDAVFLCANGDEGQEQMELKAVKDLLPQPMPAVALKGAWGETYHAGGSMAAVTASLALVHQVLPPTTGLRSSWPEGLALQPDMQAMPLCHVMILAAEGIHKATALVLSRGE